MPIYNIEDKIFNSDKYPWGYLVVPVFWEFLATGTGSSGDLQEWVVPLDGDYRITAFGAQGGGTYGGRGAKISGIFSLKSGDKLYICAGHEGTPMGYGNGTGDNNASGGGASFVKTETNTPLVVAGGGAGGMDSEHDLRHGQTTEEGGDATAGDSGNGVHDGSSWNSGNNGNAEALNLDASGCSEESFNEGGFGGGGSTSDEGSFSRTAGGGGYNGGYGTADDGNQSGGGGGSYNDGDSKEDISGDNVGDGFVNINRI